MVVRKSVHPRMLPGVHPGLQQKIREAEQAEARGEMPRTNDGAQKVLRPTPAPTSAERVAQSRTVGLVEPAYRVGQDGLAAIAAQEAFLPGVDLDKVWDTLTEVEKIRAGAVERFRMEMETNLKQSAMPWTAPHKIGGRLDARNMRRIQENLKAEIEALTYLLAPDSLALLLRFVEETRELIEECMKHKAVKGINGALMQDILKDWAEKLVYQELTSRRRAMGDRGIRRICANVDLAEPVYQFLQRLPGFTPRQRLMMRIVHVHQDLGYTAYAARVSYRGTKLHRAYGARIFTDEMERFRQFFEHRELQLCRSAVATHSSAELPFMDSLVLAMVRAVDHLAPFAPHRVYKHLENIPGVEDYLDDMLHRGLKGNIDGYLAAKEAFRKFLGQQESLTPTLRDDIWAAFRPLERGAELLQLGALAGAIAGVQLDVQPPGALVASIEPDPFAEKYQALFDVQQDQLLRLTKSTNTTLKDWEQAGTLVFQAEGAGALMLRRMG